MSETKQEREDILAREQHAVAQNDDVANERDRQAPELIPDVADYFSYADYHTDTLCKLSDSTLRSTKYSLIRDIRIDCGAQTYDDVCLKIGFSLPYFECDEIRLSHLSQENETVDAPMLRVDAERLYRLVQTDVMRMDFVLYASDGSELARAYRQIKVYPVQQSGPNFRDYAMFAKFVTPLAKGVKQITLNAVRHNGGQSLVGYQNADREALVREIGAIYQALHEYGIVYQNPPSGDEWLQRIRLPQEVLDDRKGTCLDLAILMCACLEEIGLHPLLIFTQGHAFAGCFLEEDAFYSGTEKRAGVVSNDCAMRICVLIECTAFVATEALNFRNALDAGKANLIDYRGATFCAVDVHRCHRGVYRSLPIEPDNGVLDLNIEPMRLEHQDLDDVKAVSYRDVRKEITKDRFTFWERKLLDLTEANSLVNYKFRNGNRIDLASVRDGDVAELLAERDSIEIQLYGGKTEPDEVLDLAEQLMTKKACLLGIGEEKDIKTLMRKAKTAFEETGSSTLYLCIGNLTWDKRACAPFLLLPVRVERGKTHQSYIVRYDYDDLMVNQTFFEYYRQEHPGVDYSGLYGLGGDDAYGDIVHTFQSMNAGDIQLDERRVFLTNLSFAHYIMWQDIRERRAELAANRAVASFVDNTNRIENRLVTAGKNIEQLERYAEFAAPLPYDSTQLRAILECGAGNSFILDGPPGTGKSQTIVNMIVNAMYHGKTVLFVAEKMAALEVVQERLQELQLDRFALELHSNKTNKSAFFSKLGATMDFGAVKNPMDYDAECARLDAERDELAETVNRMHVAGNRFCSMYDAIVTHERLRDVRCRVTFPTDWIAAYDADADARIRDLMFRYRESAGAVRDYDTHPFRTFGLTEIRFEDRAAFVREFGALRDAFDAFCAAYRQLFERLPFAWRDDRATVAKLMRLTELCLEGTLYLDRLPEYSDGADVERECAVFDAAQRYADARKTYADRYRFELLDTLDAAAILTDLERPRSAPARWFARLKYRRQLRRVCAAGYKVRLSALQSELERVRDVRADKAYVTEHRARIDRLVDRDVLEAGDDLARIRRAYDDTREFVRLVGELTEQVPLTQAIVYFTDLAERRDTATRMLYRLAADRMRAFRALEHEAAQRYRIDPCLYDGVQDEIATYRRMLDCACDAERFADLVHFAQLNRYAEQLRQAGVGELVDALRGGKIALGALTDVFDASLADGFLQLYFADERIHYFNESLFNAQIQTYKERLRRYSELTVARVSHRLSRNYRSTEFRYASSSPIGILKKAISNNGRGTTIRKTLSRFDAIIREYFPCFLMSPLSAAQYLDVHTRKFDVVIFDEASQIPTHEAIGPIARGNSLIVAGDPQQMPPSAYFTGDPELEEEDRDYEDSESLLDECISIRMPRYRLAYHYRSRHESLIAFSNDHFYDGELFTFPSADARASRISFVPVELKADKKNSDISREEIRAILDQLQQILSDPTNVGKSIGIIVFNIRQQEQLSDAVADFLDKNASLRHALEQAKDEMFVKSLENVQGDERDIILLSVGFRKNASGKATIVGPLAQQKGERRLNVAVSRSKERMIVISTIRAADIAESKAKNEGARYLKQFLQLAQSGEYRADADAAQNEDGVVEYLARDLRERGHVVDARVGNSEFCVDLAIRNPSGDGYALGILIDRKAIGPNVSCRDKMYVQPSVLNGLRWKLVRVFAVEYLRNKSVMLDRIEEALRRPYERERMELHPCIEKDDVAFAYDSQTYRCTRSLPTILASSVYDGDREAIDGLRLALKRIVDEESPVSLATIKARMREVLGLQKMSQKASDTIEAQLCAIGAVRTPDQGQDFYWRRDMSRDMTTFRGDDGARRLDDIAKEELAAAMRQILQIQISLSDDDLYKETLRAFGFETLTQTARDRLAYVREWMRRKDGSDGTDGVEA